jgi:uncharacterized membrane protein YhaH (DUF805 family)
MNDYFVKIEFQPEFGINSTEMIKRINEGQIPSNALVRKVGSEAWNPLSSYPEFVYLTPPPLPVTVRNEPDSSACQVQLGDKATIPAYFLPVGRINGSIFFFRNIINFLCISLIGAFVGSLPESAQILNFFPIVIWLYLIIVTASKRLHDWNITGWLSPIVLVPFVALLFWLIPGNKNSNRFGDKLNGVWCNLFKA